MFCSLLDRTFLQILSQDDIGGAWKLGRSCKRAKQKSAKSKSGRAAQQAGRDYTKKRVMYGIGWVIKF